MYKRGGKIDIGFRYAMLVARTAHHNNVAPRSIRRIPLTVSDDVE